jgi:hypothetical protein
VRYLTLLLLVQSFAIGLIYVSVIRVHPFKCSSIRRALVLDLTIFVTLNSCSQWQLRLLPNTDNIHEAWFWISGSYFSSYRVTIQNCTRAAQNTSANRGLTPPSVDLHRGLQALQVFYAILFLCTMGRFRERVEEKTVVFYLHWNDVLYSTHRGQNKLAQQLFNVGPPPPNN